MKPRTNVLVTGVGGRSVGHQILHALLLAPPEAYRPVVTDADPFSFGLYLVPDHHLVPTAASPGYLPALLELIRRERIQVILPGTEPEVRVVSEQRAVLEAAGCVVVASPPEPVKLCANKERLYDWLAANGFGVPRSVASTEWRRLVAETGFPIVGKPTEESGGSRGVALLNDESEVERYLGERPLPGQVVFQEYVGSGDGEYTVGVMVSRDGKIIDSIVMHRKLIGLSLGLRRRIDSETYSLSTGYSQGFLIRHPFIQQECERLVLALGLRGPTNIQLRLVEGKVVVFEVHPRFSGTTSIRGSAGFNEPDILIRNFLFGEEFGRLDYRSDVAAIRAFQHVLVPMADLDRLSAQRPGV
ncbi:MAG TPA: carbamoyl phosphate synthase [Verrucomicrobiales bacterium]|nr:carbamoyl phosphate synthase [Verrucomicrobiales bacterium]